MRNSLLKEMNDQSLEAYLSERTYEAQYWPTFFPLETVLSLSYQTLIGSNGRPVAADVVSFDSSAPEKSRPVVEKLSGNIPAIKIARAMLEKDLQEYDQLKRMAASDSRKTQILNLIYNDVDFCVEGSLARYEFLCLKALNQQAINLTSTNNVGRITETSIDFQMAAANKRVIANANVNRKWTYWESDASKPKPFTDIKLVKSVAKASGVILKYVIMNIDKFNEMLEADQVKDFCRPFSAYDKLIGDASSPVPTLDVVNRYLSSAGLPLLMVIDSSIRVENVDHTITTIDPFTEDSGGTDKFITFLANIPCGNLLSGPITEESHKVDQVTYAKKGSVLISKFGETNPVKEFTVGQSNAFPSFPDIDTTYRLDTEAVSAGGVEV